MAVKFAKAFGAKVTVIIRSPDKKDEAIHHLGPLQCFFLEKATIEQGTKMCAMDSLNRNAGEMLGCLTHTYNRSKHMDQVQRSKRKIVLILCLRVQEVKYVNLRTFFQWQNAEDDLVGENPHSSIFSQRFSTILELVNKLQVFQKCGPSPQHERGSSVLLL